MSGSAFGQVRQLDGSHPTTIGRAPEAEFSIPTDPLMSSMHCRISPSADGFWVEDLHSTNGTFVNGVHTDRRLLRDGDTIRCGDTELQVAIDAGGQAPVTKQPKPAAAPDEAPAPAAPPPTPPPAQPHRHPTPARATEMATSLAELGPELGYVSSSPLAIVDNFGLADSMELLPDGGESVEQFLDRLLQAERHVDALKFLAAALPKRSAVWWARECVLHGAADQLKPQDKQALDLSAAWVKEPSEQLRRQAMAAAQAVNCETPAAWVAVAVFWSHGSMGPPEAPPVPPGQDLTAKAVAGAVQLAAVVQQPERAAEKQKHFIAAARQIAGNEKPWAKAGETK